MRVSVGKLWLDGLYFRLNEHDAAVGDILSAGGEGVWLTRTTMQGNGDGKPDTGALTVLPGPGVFAASVLLLLYCIRVAAY
jgi:hypothetical protein